jgi:hypothetical protein
MSPIGQRIRSALHGTCPAACGSRPSICDLRRHPRSLLILILLAHTALGVIYSVTVPAWEAHDEIGHYYFARYLATERRLPTPGTKIIEHNDESHQPPLYYILAALGTAWIDTGDRHSPPDDPQLVLNPFVATDGGFGGANAVVHDPAVESFPYRGTILALHATRLVSVALSTLGLVATYGIGRRLFPGSPDLALGATAINAFWPQYLFVGSVVTNDIMVTTCASWFFLFLVRLLSERPSDERVRFSDWLGMGLSLGAALMSKNNGLALLPVAVVGSALALIRMARRPTVRSRLLERISAVGVGLLALAGWWYARNVLIYGGIFGSYQNRARFFFDPPTQPFATLGDLNWNQLLIMLRYGFVTFWASFGWGNVGLSDGVYILVAAFCLLAALGLVSFLIRDRQRRLELFLLGFAVLSFVAVYINLTRGSDYLRGRICLPLIAPVSLLLAAGWRGVFPLNWRRWGLGLISTAMALNSLLLPLVVIGPAYVRPRQLTDLEIQTIPHPLDITFGDSIQLIGYDLGQSRVKPGEALFVTLYWRALGEVEGNYTLAVKAIGHDGTVYGTRHLFPGRGNFATSLWKQGDTFRETYWVPITSQSAVRILGLVSVSFFLDDDSLEHLTARDAHAGAPGGSALLGRFKIAGTPARPTPSREVSFQMGDRISLIGYDPPQGKVLAGQSVDLTLYWEAGEQVAEDYTVFLHLVDEDGNIAAQGDAPPAGGSYPTGLWEGGEVIADGHVVHLPEGLPPGRYQILVGLYRLDTLGRLPVLTSAGKRMIADAAPVGDVQVSHLDHRLFVPFVGHAE